MTPTEATQIVGMALAAYPTQAAKISGDAVMAMRAMWADLFADMDFAAVKAALLVHCRTAKFLPSPAEIRELVTRGAQTGRSGLAAWADVLKAISRYGVHRVPQFDDPLVKRAVASVGWSAICNSEEPGVERAHFAKVYDRLAADERHVAQAGPALAALGAAVDKPAHRLVGEVAAQLGGARRLGGAS